MENLPHSKRFLQCAWSTKQTSLIGWRGPLPDHDTEAMMQCASSTQAEHFACALLLDLLDVQINAVKGQFSASTHFGKDPNTASLLQLACLPASCSEANVALFLSRHLHAVLGMKAKVVQKFSRPNKRANPSATNQHGINSARLGKTRIGYATLGKPAADGFARFNIEISQLSLMDLFSLSHTHPQGIRIANAIEKTIHSGLASTDLQQADCQLQISFTSTANTLRLNRKQPAALGMNSFLKRQPAPSVQETLLRKTLPIYRKEKPQ